MKSALESKALGLALLVASLSLGGALLAAVPIKKFASSTPSQAEESSPSPELVSSPELVEQGHQFYIMSCLECHGDDAHGDESPDLHNLTISNARIATTIKKGVKGEMPSFTKKYDDAQVSALLAYLRSLH